MIGKRPPMLNKPTKEKPQDPKKKEKKPNPKSHMEKILGRFQVDVDIVKKLVLNIKDGDIYKQTRAYPRPETRSFALAPQASVLFVLLCFIPKELENNRKLMREIVDKHFGDNWVIPIFTGYLVDLFNEWQYYPGCTYALECINDQYIRELSVHYADECTRIQQKLEKEILLQGVLTKEYTIKNCEPLMNITREANMTCRWLMLHRLSMHRGFRKLVRTQVDMQSI